MAVVAMSVAVVAINGIVYLVWDPPPEQQPAVAPVQAPPPVRDNLAGLTPEERDLAEATDAAYTDLVTHIKIVDPNNEQVYLEDLRWGNGLTDMYERADCVHTKAMVHLRLTCEGVSMPLCP